MNGVQRALASAVDCAAQRARSAAEARIAWLVSAMRARPTEMMGPTLGDRVWSVLHFVTQDLRGASMPFFAVLRCNDTPMLPVKFAHRVWYGSLCVRPSPKAEKSFLEFARHYLTPGCQPVSHQTQCSIWPCSLQSRIRRRSWRTALSSTRAAIRASTASPRATRVSSTAVAAEAQSTR